MEGDVNFKHRRWVAVLVVAAALATAAPAQDPAAEMREAAQQFDNWMAVIGEYIRGVEFDERDVQRLIQHWSEFEGLNLSGDDEIRSDEFRAELDRVQRDPKYRDWATSIGANPDTWLRKGMRIQTAVMQDQAASMRAQWESERARQTALVEAQCAQMGPDACTEMKAMLSAGVELADKMLKAREKLPKPTAAEVSLIEQYRLDLLAVVDSEP
jgi:hypothetical protein